MSRGLRNSLLASAALLGATTASGAFAQVVVGPGGYQTPLSDDSATGGPGGPVDYVRVCDAFGSGFFYIPGTDTCLKIGGYVRGDLVEGPDYRIRGFAFEPQKGQLQNPAFDFDVETDGHRLSAGFNLGRIAGLSPDETGTILRNVRFGVDYLDVEGRAFLGGGGGFLDVEGRAFPNFAIPGVGQDFGTFINFPTSVLSSGSVSVERWGVKGEVVIDPFAGRQIISLHPSVRTSIFILAGFQAGWTETGIGHTAWANTPAFGNQGNTWARYRTQIDERSITPYVGLSMHNVVGLTDVTKLHIGLSGRLGPSFTEFEVHDSLRAEGIGGAINIVQDIHLQSDDTLTYGSVSGMVGISGGPFKVSLVGMAEHGLLNQPNLFRADSREVGNGQFETVPTKSDFEEDWTYSVGVRMSVSLQGLFQPRREFQ